MLLGLLAIYLLLLIPVWILMSDRTDYSQPGKTRPSKRVRIQNLLGKIFYPITALCFVALFFYSLYMKMKYGK